ncbi:efflux RND transporter permease subunit [bacterium]|nr:efflux RND transporter permease subunit [bacterium]
MKKVIEYFIRYNITGDILLILIVIFGIFGLRSLKSTMFPERDSNTIMIQISYPGSSPEEIEESVVLKIEDKLKGLVGLDEITSVSSENTASITITVKLGFDTDEVLQDAKNAVDQIPSFPVGVENINVFKQQRLRSAITFVLSGDVDLKTLKSYARKIERDLLSSVNISQVEISGYPAEEISINIDELKLRAFDLTFQDVMSKVAASNIETTGGTIIGEQEELKIRAKNKVYYGNELNDIVIKSSPDGRVVRLRDVAVITDTWAETPNKTFFNGQPSVTIDVKNTFDEDIITIAEEVNTYVEEFNASSPIVKATITDDNADYINQRIALLLGNGFIGFILVVVLLTFFLHYRLSFWVALSIPVSFAGMFILAGFYGLTINVLSLFGMIVVIGILVDDGVVISENIYQHYERGKSPLKAAIDGTMEVIPAVFSAIITTIIVFSTFFFLEGRLGDFFPQVSFVVIGCLIFSLVEGALILPAHVAHSKALKRDSKQSKLTIYTNKIMDWLRYKFYKPLLEFSLRNRLLMLSIPVALWLITLGAWNGGIIGKSLFPNVEEEMVRIVVEMPAGTPVEETDRVLEQIENAAWQVNKELKEETGDSNDYIISADRRLGPVNAYQGRLNVQLIATELREMSALEISNRIEEATGLIPGSQIDFGGSGNRWGKPVSIAIRGEDLNEVDVVVQKTKDKLKTLADLKDVVDNSQEGLREINIKLKEKAYLLGLTERDVISQVRQGYFGGEVQRLQRGLDEVKIWVRYEKGGRSSYDDLHDVYIRTSDGRSFPLTELADFNIKRGIVGINHRDGNREILVEASTVSPKVQIVDLISTIQDVYMPEILAAHPTVHFSMEGQNEERRKSFGSMSKVLPIIFLLMFAVVAFTFRSLSQTLSLIPLIVLSFVGVVWGHYVHGLQVSLLSLMGFIALIGVLINDTLVFIGAFNINLKHGQNFHDALVNASISRFRPILLTSLTTIAGLAPLILEKSRQAQYLIPMAVTMAYGLAFSTLLVLIVLPIILDYFNQFKRFIQWWWNDRKVEAKTVERAYKEVHDPDFNLKNIDND